MFRRCMASGASTAFALVRIPQGDPRPSDAAFLEALRDDRVRLHLPEPVDEPAIEIAGPYSIAVDGALLDEYVVWER